jgi:hypothetical protein
MDESDLEPTWEASEKGDVKRRTARRRLVARSIETLTGREIPKIPNRAIVSQEKCLTADTQKKSEDIYQKLDGTLSKQQRK